MSNFSKTARSLFMEIQKIDSNYYPEVGGFFGFITSLINNACNSYWFGSRLCIASLL